jgi:hypothetical protein
MRYSLVPTLCVGAHFLAAPRLFDRPGALAEEKRRRASKKRVPTQSVGTSARSLLD